MARQARYLTIATTGILGGCGGFSFQEAAAAGAFDFVAGSVTTILTGLLPFESLLDAARM